ncbi:hypothetical protein DFJ74DRAFT_671448 [Hyaloraphidium curvatum]|nr:hypothetical protein DFJ74DRAFT_671448 [Hyaloraphidium curvatum]
MPAIGNMAYYGLEERLQRQTMRIALRHALNKDADMKPHAEPVVVQPVASSELCVRLHYLLMRQWKARANQDLAFASQLIIFTVFPFLFLCAIPTISTGRCILAWYTITFLLYLVYMFVNIFNLPARNAAIPSVVALYHDALREIRVLTANDPSGPLRRHEAVLASFLEVSELRGRVLGFEVTYGTARGLLVTLVTLCVGLWSVLRGLGIFFTVESFCPSV